MDPIDAMIISFGGLGFGIFGAAMFWFSTITAQKADKYLAEANDAARKAEKLRSEVTTLLLATAMIEKAKGLEEEQG